MLLEYRMLIGLLGGEKIDLIRALNQSNMWWLCSMPQSYSDQPLEYFKNGCSIRAKISVTKEKYSEHFSTCKKMKKYDISRLRMETTCRKKILFRRFISRIIDSKKTDIHALITLTESLKNTLDNKKFGCGIFLDLKSF